MDPYDTLTDVSTQYAKQQAWQRSAQANQAVTQVKPQEQPHTAAIRDSLNTALQIASETHSIISGLSERLFGCDPPQDQTAATGLQSVPNGAADEALHSARTLCLALNTLRAAASRLDYRL